MDNALVLRIGLLKTVILPHTRKFVVVFAVVFPPHPFFFFFFFLLLLLLLLLFCPFFFFFFFLSLFSFLFYSLGLINQAEWSMIPECPSHICFIKSGNIKGTNSSEISV